MPKKKKPLRTRFRSRLQNIREWVKHPSLAGGIFLILALFVATVFLSFPCYRSGPAMHGFCGSVPMVSGLEVAIIAVSFGFIITLYLTGRETPPSKAELRKILKRSDRPKWWKKWFPVFLVPVYLAFSGLTFWVDIDAGLRWYHYVAQYGVTVPFFSVVFTSWLIGKWRRVRHLPILQ